jgi:hypothetical protein
MRWYTTRSLGVAGRTIPAGTPLPVFIETDEGLLVKVQGYFGRGAFAREDRPPPRAGEAAARRQQEAGEAARAFRDWLDRFPGGA